jgi:hypothetical protein
MDATDSLYDLEDKDRALLDAVAAPTLPVPGATPVPELPETEITEPPAAVDAVSGPTVPADVQLDAIAAAPAPVPPEVGPGATKMPKDASISPTAVDKQLAVDKERAAIDAATADKTAALAQQADDNDRLAYADYLERRKAGEEALASATKAAQKAELVDPRSKTPGWRSALAVIFGALGAGMSAAGGGDATNRGLQTLIKTWDDDLELQKANIGRLKDNVAMARTGLNSIDDARQAMRLDANARTLGRYNLAIKQGEAQLRKLGVPAAEIAADQRLAALRAARAAVEAQARKDTDEHELAQARAKWYGSKAQRNAKGGGAARGAASADAAALLSQHLIDNPGDIPGVNRLASKLAGEGRLKDPTKAVQAAVAQTKAPESQAKDARQATVGLRAIDDIEKSGYKPDKNDIQKWLNNSRLVHMADKGGVVGGGATIAQNIPVPFGGGKTIVPQSEVDGLSPEAAAYFGNVRRYMETIGRAQSGAAISPSEWTNFFNQYGPNSSGGMAAARQYLRDQFKVSGVAGRQLDAGGSVPKEGGAKPAANHTAAVEWAKANKSDPRAREILRRNGVR